jgi:hypothetical protein
VRRPTRVVGNSLGALVALGARGGELLNRRVVAGCVQRVVRVLTPPWAPDLRHRRFLIERTLVTMSSSSFAGTVEVAELSVIGGVELPPVSSASANADRLAGASCVTCVEVPAAAAGKSTASTCERVRRSARSRRCQADEVHRTGWLGKFGVDAHGDRARARRE